jgi:hypothetical protein
MRHATIGYGSAHDRESCSPPDERRGDLLLRRLKNVVADIVLEVEIAAFRLAIIVIRPRHDSCGRASVRDVALVPPSRERGAVLYRHKPDR